MRDVNLIVLSGRLGQTPLCEETKGGHKLARLRLANEVNKGETHWYNVVVWGRQAEVAAQYLKVGSYVYVEGRVEKSVWNSDGQKHSRVDIIAERVKFLGEPAGLLGASPTVAADRTAGSPLGDAIN